MIASRPWGSASRCGVACALALALVSCSNRDAEVPVVVVFPYAAVGTPVMEGVQSLRLSIRKGTPGGLDMKVLEDRIYPPDVERVSIRGERGGRDRFVVLEGLAETPAELAGGAPPTVLARGSTVPDDYLPGGAEPPADGEYGTVYLFFGRVNEMSALEMSPLVPRAFFGAAPLRGGDIAIAGGLGEDGPLTTVEVFRRDGFYFTGTGVMSSARAYPAMSSIGGKGALIAGGAVVAVTGTAMTPIATAQRLDDDGTPLGIEYSMGSPRMFLTAVPVVGPNGESQAIVAGGATSPDVSDPERQVERWDGSQFVPYQPMLIARAGLASAQLFDGTALLVGGFSREPFGTGTIAKVSDSAERIDTSDAASPFEKVSGMRPHWAHTATTLEFGDVLVAGGSSLPPDESGIALATSSADLFLSDFEAFSALPPMATPRAHHAAAPLADGRALVCGGSPLAGAWPGSGIEPIDSCELLAPNADGEIGMRWEPGPTLLFPRYGHAMFALPDGSVLVVGGVSPRPDREADLAPFAEIYTPEWPEPE